MSADHFFLDYEIMRKYPNLTQINSKTALLQRPDDVFTHTWTWTLGTLETSSTLNNPRQLKLWFQTRFWDLPAPQMTLKVWRCFHWAWDVVSVFISLWPPSLDWFPLQSLNVMLGSLYSSIVQRVPETPVALSGRSRMHTRQEIRSGGERNNMFPQQPLLLSMKWSGMFPAGQMVKRSVRNIPHRLQKCRLPTSRHYGKVGEQHCI